VPSGLKQRSNDVKLDKGGGVRVMKGKRVLMNGMFTGIAVVGDWAFAAQDKYTVKVPNGLAFSEFRGYEATWRILR
jgi:hypothetical protein